MYLSVSLIDERVKKLIHILSQNTKKFWKNKKIWKHLIELFSINLNL